MPEKTTIRALKMGEFFTKNPVPEPNMRQVWVRGEYDRSVKKYWCYRFWDVCDGAYFPASREVFTEFTF